MSYSQIPTLIAQAAAGFVFGAFVVIIGRLLLVNDPYAVAYVATVPCLLFYAPLIGIPSGLTIWICGRVADRPLNTTYRCVVAVLILALPSIGYAVLISWTPAPAEQASLLAFLLVVGIAIGLVTNSRLRLGHELIRNGDAKGRIPRMLASLSGLFLRPLVVLLFMVCLIALIGIFQSDYYQREDRIWSVLFLAHFAGGFTLLFSRMRISLLLPLALVVNVPMILAVFSYKYFVGDLWPAPVVYLGVWVVFLLSRWRQTDVALSFLNEEIHYYLID